MGGLGRPGGHQVITGMRQMLGLSGGLFAKQMALHDAPLGARPHAVIGTVFLLFCCWRSQLSLPL